MPREIERAALPYICELLSALRVVIVNGPRQAGKTTLLGLLQRAHGGGFRSLDERQVLAGALRDPPPSSPPGSGR